MNTRSRLLSRQQSFDVRVAQSGRQGGRGRLRPQALFKDRLGPLEPVRPGQRLLHLHAASVAMQVAERPQIDQHVEHQRIAATVFAQQIVVPPAVTDREIEHLLRLRLTEVRHNRLDLTQAVTSRVVAIQERRHDLA